MQVISHVEDLTMDLLRNHESESESFDEFLDFAAEELYKRMRSNKSVSTMTKSEFRSLVYSKASQLVACELFGDDEKSLRDLIIENNDWSDFISSDKDKVEFIVNLNQAPGESMNDAYLYNHALSDLDESSIQFYERVLPALGLNGYEIIEAFEDELSGTPSLVSKLTLIDAKYLDRKPVVEPLHFINVMSFYGTYSGNAILMGYAPSRELIDTDPRGNVKLSGEVQFGMQDFISGGGYLEGIDAKSIIFEDGSLLNYEIGCQGTFPNLDSVYMFDKRQVTIYVENVDKDTIMSEPRGKRSFGFSDEQNILGDE